MVLIQTDFPDPVVPAIRRCGMAAKSPIIGFPEIFLPSAIGNFVSFDLKSELVKISLK